MTWTQKYPSPVHNDMEYRLCYLWPCIRSSIIYIYMYCGVLSVEFDAIVQCCMLAFLEAYKLYNSHGTHVLSIYARYYTWIPIEVWLRGFTVFVIQYTHITGKTHLNNYNRNNTIYIVTNWWRWVNDATGYPAADCRRCGDYPQNIRRYNC